MRPADLDRRFRIRLWGVVAIFALAIAATLWVGYREADAQRDELARKQFGLIETNLLRRLDFYGQTIGRLAADPETHDQIVLGDAASQQHWAEISLRFLPGVLGLALVGPQAQVLGNAGDLRVGAACMRDLEKPGALGRPHLLVHRDNPDLAHFDITVPVTGPGGDGVGGVFLSIRLDQLQRVIDDSRFPDHALQVIDAAGETVVRAGAAPAVSPDIEQPLRDTGWRIRVWGAPPALSHAQIVMIAIATAALLAVLTIMLEDMRTLQRNIHKDLVTIRDGLAAVAAGTPPPPLVPTYVQFQPAIREIERMAIEIEKQRSEFARQSLTDTLTGLPNRRALEGRFSQMLGFAQRGHAVALVLMDLDHFKSLNDNQGHAAGDKALLALAHALTATSRNTDFAARLAGDEFVALLAALDTEGIAAWFLRLGDRFQAELRAAGIDASLSLSAGCTWLAGNDTLSRVLKRADRALYRAKAEGRAQIVFHADMGDAAAR